MFRATSVSWPEAEELLWRTAFRVFALRHRALASLLLALERRRIAHPAKDYANFQVGLQQGFAPGEMGFNINLRAKILNGSLSGELVRLVMRCSLS